MKPHRVRFAVAALVAAALLVGCGGQSADKVPTSEDKKDDDTLVLGGGDKKPDDTRPPGNQTITFLNSQGTGRHFCFIADCSMSISPPSFDLIRRELVKSVEGLGDDSYFYPIFFAKKEVTMPGERGWLSSKKDLERTRAWMDGVTRFYGTNAAPAFDKAFKMTPPPDVIFFMTDGQLTDKPATDSVLTRAPKLVIHTILFRNTAVLVPETNQARKDLEKIASDFGGTFKQFIDPDALPKKKKKKA